MILPASVPVIPPSPPSTVFLRLLLLLLLPLRSSSSSSIPSNPPPTITIGIIHHIKSTHFKRLESQSFEFDPYLVYLFPPEWCILLRIDFDFETGGFLCESGYKTRYGPCGKSMSGCGGGGGGDGIITIPTTFNPIDGVTILIPTPSVPSSPSVSIPIIIRIPPFLSLSLSPSRSRFSGKYPPYRCFVAENYLKMSNNSFTRVASSA